MEVMNMNEVTCLNLQTGETFTRYFNDLKAQRLFLLKCKHSKKVMVVSYTWQTYSQYEYLEFGR